jgi:hypothetical protein
MRHFLVPFAHEIIGSGSILKEYMALIMDWEVARRALIENRFMTLLLGCI